jgi:hypothetical protein
VTGLVYVALGVLFVGFIVEGIVLLGVMRQLGAVLIEVKPEMPKDVGGGPDPTLVLDLGHLALADAKHGAVLAFISPNCQLCEQLHAPLVALGSHYPAVQVNAVVSYGSEEERRLLAASLDGIARLDLGHLVDDWNIPGTPYAVSFDRSGRLRGRGVVTTTAQLEMMAEAAAISPEAHDNALRRLEVGSGAESSEASTTEHNEIGVTS